jgi:predicted enzyme related to lactoylglutathione lyase
MGDRESYAPGTFSWVALGAADRDAVVGFYGALLGWEAEGDAFLLDGRRVGGLGEGAPRWASYVAVADVEAAAARAEAIGGERDGDGIRDPAGAIFHLRSLEGGAERVNDPGCFGWNELATNDPDRARKFYGELFGWTAEADETGYATIRNGDALNGGIRPLRDGEPPNWLVYFTVESVADAVDAAAGAGGGVEDGPFDVQLGRIAVVSDPQGATFGLFEGQNDP